MYTLKFENTTLKKLNLHDLRCWIFWLDKEGILYQIKREYAKQKTGV